MLNPKEIYRLQSENGVNANTVQIQRIKFSEYVKSCREYTRVHNSKEYAEGKLTAEQKYAEMKKIISDFVNKNKVAVDGYIINEEGDVDLARLMEDLIDAVTGEGVLKDALEDETVDEIQINDKDTIFVIRGGIASPYLDRQGKPVKFDSNEEIWTVVNKMIDDGSGNTASLSDGKPIVNAKTAKKQYRVNAVHSSVNARDSYPNDGPITTITIRKFKETKLSMEDLVKGGSMTEQMGRLLRKIGEAGFKTFFVGKTGSGKTTLLRAVLESAPIEDRIIFIQNPTEISFFERDEYGRNKRNALHWEANERASMSDLLSNTLRSTPDKIICGEARETSEFKEIKRSLQMGETVLGTFHADDAVEAMHRFAEELAMDGASYIDCLRSVCSAIDIIVAQHKYRNGDRRVTEISEIVGFDEDTKDVVVNTLFMFEENGKVEIDSKGNKRTCGEFKQTGYLSKKMVRKFYREAIARADIAEFMRPEEEDIQ